MVMTVDSATRPIWNSVNRSVENGISTTLLPDAYSELFDDNYFKYQFWAPECREAASNIQRLERMLGTLTAKGAQVAYTHPYQLPTHPINYIPFAGRSHIKANVFDDTLDVGGVNLSDRYFQAIDYMLRIYNADAADFVYEYQQSQYDDPTVPHMAALTHDVDSRSRILIDTGHRGNSLIYDEAIDTITRAESLTILTQYPPKGRLRRILSAKQEKAGQDSIRIYSNDWRQFVMPGAILRKVESEMRPSVTVAAHRSNKFIHAKLLLAKMPDGARVTIGGSHNYQESLVRLGTAEIALQSTDPAVFEKLTSFAENQLSDKELSY